MFKIQMKRRKKGILKLSFGQVLLCLAASSFLILPVCKQNQPNFQLKIISFNIRYDNPGDGQNNWNNRKDIAAQTILFHDADICGLQEVLDHQLQDLAELLPGYHWIGVGRDDGAEAGEYAPIFFRPDRIDMLETGFFWLSETPEKPGTLGWDAACPRIVTWGKFSVKNTGEDFFFFNTHFDHMGQVAREKSAGLLRKRIESLAAHEPVFVTGDFNCTHHDKAYALLTSGENDGPPLQDTCNLSQNGHYGGTQTFNGFSQNSQPDTVIDFIFVRHTGPVIHHGIIADRWDGRFVSDHYPVYAKVAISN